MSLFFNENMDQKKIQYFDVKPAPFTIGDSLPTYRQSISYQKNVGFSASAVARSKKAFVENTPLKNVSKKE